MTISYPLSLPTSGRIASGIDLQVASQVGMTRSPFTGAMQTYAWPNEYWSAQFSLPPMKRAIAEPWIAFLLALNGMEGSFLMGEPGYTTPQGTWSGGSPLVNGASQSGKTLNIKNLADGVTWKAGDYFQLGTGSTSRLYKITQDGAQVGSPSGFGVLCFTPRIRTSPADAAAITLASPKGMFMLADNDGKWSKGEAQVFGLQFAVCEDLRDL